MTHPPATIELVYALWQTGLSASEIAAELAKDGITISKNGVIGIWNRNRDRFPMRMPEMARGRRPKALGNAEPAPLADGCRWPIGHPGEPGFRFCGAERHVRASSYCDEHAAMARAPAPTAPPAQRGRHASGEGKPWRA